MGLFDWFTGTKRPAAGMVAKPPDAVRAAIVAVNRATAPFVVRDGGAEGVDLVAEWKIVDAAWYEIFAKAGLQKVFKVLMKLDPAAKEVRSVDQEWTVEWRAGVPEMSLSKSSFRGQKTSVELGTAYAFTKQFTPGQVYKYRFSTKEMKDPLQEAVTASGWTWKAVAFGKL